MINQTNQTNNNQPQTNPVNQAPQNPVITPAPQKPTPPVQSASQVTPVPPVNSQNQVNQEIVSKFKPIDNNQNQTQNTPSSSPVSKEQTGQINQVLSKFKPANNSQPTPLNQPVSPKNQVPPTTIPAPQPKPKPTTNPVNTMQTPIESQSNNSQLPASIPPAPQPQNNISSQNTTAESPQIVPPQPVSTPPSAPTLSKQPIETAPAIRPITQPQNTPTTSSIPTASAEITPPTNQPPEISAEANQATTSSTLPLPNQQDPTTQEPTAIPAEPVNQTEGELNPEIVSVPEEEKPRKTKSKNKKTTADKKEKQTKTSIFNQAKTQLLSKFNKVKNQPSPMEKEAGQLAKGMTNLQDLLAPAAVEVDYNYIKVSDIYYRTYFITGYPREVGANWLAPLINFSSALDIGMFYYPVEAKNVLKNLRRKITELETELNIERKEGRILDPEIQLALQDSKDLQEAITAERERFFQFGLYITVPAEDKKELTQLCHQLESILNSILVVPRKATLQMGEAFKTTIPQFNDTLKVSRNMDTTSIATTLPFTSSSLSSDRGIMYGINEHNGSLIIFDRFQMENANSVVFGISGSGKSYMVKLEAVRSLMLGTAVTIIDPENEYKTLSDTIGGSFINLNFNSKSRINPFDLPQDYSNEEGGLNYKILTLHSLFKIILGELNSEEEAILDKALLMAYRMKGITQNPETFSLEPPLMEDLYKVFLGMEEESAKNIANRLEKFVLGSAKGLLNQHTNIDLDNTFICFGVRDLPEDVRPIGMFIILDYIWTKVRRERKKRLLLVDEAWLMMKYPDSAQFLYSVAKRGRKYYLGLTTITQNIDEFLQREEGRAIVNNAAIRILMKQSPSAIDQLAEVFYLSEGEKNLLLSSNIGEGIFFAGKSHVAIQVVPSMDEHELITTNPAELSLREKEQKQMTV